MTAIEIIVSCSFGGIRLDLTPEGGLHYSGDPSLVAEWLPILRENKAVLVTELHREHRSAKVLAMLQAEPGKQRAIYVDDASDPHNVILTVVVRACQQTCEMLIPKDKYDPWRLLEFIERYRQVTH